MSRIKQGDVVREKRGGPKMTAVLVGTMHAQCEWFEKWKLVDAIFPLDELEKVGKRGGGMIVPS